MHLSAQNEMDSNNIRKLCHKCGERRTKFHIVVMVILFVDNVAVTYIDREREIHRHSLGFYAFHIFTSQPNTHTLAHPDRKIHRHKNNLVRQHYITVTHVLSSRSGTQTHTYTLCDFISRANEKNDTNAFNRRRRCWLPFLIFVIDTFALLQIANCKSLLHFHFPHLLFFWLVLILFDYFFYRIVHKIHIDTRTQSQTHECAEHLKETVFLSFYFHLFNLGQTFKSKNPF